jgi:hypothetical protein
MTQDISLTELYTEYSYAKRKYTTQVRPLTW